VSRKLVAIQVSVSFSPKKEKNGKGEISISCSELVIYIQGFKHLQRQFDVEEPNHVWVTDIT